MVRNRTPALFLAALGLALVSGIFAQDKKVVIIDQWPIKNPKGQSELSPPVVEQSNQCAKSVFVTGFIPGATITVFLGGSTVIGGPFPSIFGFVDVPVTHQLLTNDKITAIQTVNGVKSAASAIMTVSAMPSSLPSPTIDTHLFACGRIAAVHNLVSGVTVEIRDTTTNTVVGTGATPNAWGSDWDPVGTSSLTKSHLLVAKQSACTGPSAGSAKFKVLADPSPAVAPTLDTPIVGNDAITTNGLYIGSLLDVPQGAVIGSGFSTASSNWMTVATIKASPKVTAQQALCAKGPISSGVTPTTTIPAPTLVGPICPGSLGAVVRNTTINATLVLLKNNTVVGYGGAGPGDVELNLATPNDFAQGDTIQVVEYIGLNTVFSNKITVGCTSTLTYHNDPQRTGWNRSENTLTPSNVTPSTFGFITKTNLDDEVDTQPLVVTNQNISGQGIRTVVYVTTESNTVYALDSWSGASLLPPRSLGTPVPMPLGCTNNGPQVGINGTPVIDQKTQTMYVIAYTLISGTPTYQLHALDLSTLKDKSGSPVTVKATHGPTSFNASVQRQRSALLLTNGNVYAAFASFCDFSPDQSRGWVLGWNAGTLAPLGANELTNTLATSPSNFFLSSIWMSGYGVAADTSGNVFFVTGNSDPNANTYTGTTNIQESVVKMTPDLTKVLDLFTPSNVFPLDQGDTDYGSGGVMVIPDLTGAVPRLAVAAGKDGRNFILNRDKMGGFHNPDIPKHVVVDACWCGPSFFRGSDGVPRVVSGGGLTTRTWKVDTSAATALSLEATAARILFRSARRRLFHYHFVERYDREYRADMGRCASRGIGHAFDAGSL